MQGGWTSDDGPPRARRQARLDGGPGSHGGREAQGQCGSWRLALLPRAGPADERTTQVLHHGAPWWSRTSTRPSMSAGRRGRLRLRSQRGADDGPSERAATAATPGRRQARRRAACAARPRRRRRAEEDEAPRRRRRRVKSASVGPSPLTSLRHISLWGARSRSGRRPRHDDQRARWCRHRPRPLGRGTGGGWAREPHGLRRSGRPPPSKPAHEEGSRTRRPRMSVGPGAAAQAADKRPRPRKRTGRRSAGCHREEGRGAVRPGRTTRRASPAGQHRLTDAGAVETTRPSGAARER